MECRLQPRCRINEKERVIDEMFLAEFREEYLGDSLISRRSELQVQQAIRCRIDDGVQSETLVIQLDHGLINRDMIRISAIKRL